VAVEPAFEDRGVARPGRELAHTLGRAVGVVGLSFGAQLSPFVRAAKERFLPPLPPPAWSQAILAAAVRAYIPLMYPHGSWAPLDEETSLYEVDLEGRTSATSVGRPLPHGARREGRKRRCGPIETGDLVLGGGAFRQWGSRSGRDRPARRFRFNRSGEDPPRGGLAQRRGARCTSRSARRRPSPITGMARRACSPPTGFATVMGKR
jgi:hypothetical protein